MTLGLGSCLGIGSWDLGLRIWGLTLTLTRFWVLGLDVGLGLYLARSFTWFFCLDFSFSLSLPSPRLCDSLFVSLLLTRIAAREGRGRTVLRKDSGLLTLGKGLSLFPLPSCSFLIFYFSHLIAGRKELGCSVLRKDRTLHSAWQRWSCERIVPYCTPLGKQRWPCTPLGTKQLKRSSCVLLAFVLACARIP